MSFIRPVNFGGPDALRYECIDILHNYIPSREPRSVRAQVPSGIDHAKAKEKFRLKNEEYVEAIKGVMQVGKEAARRRNLQAVEN